MEVAIKIDTQSKEAKALIEYLGSLPFVTFSKGNAYEDKVTDELTEDQMDWINRLKEAANDVKNNNKSKFRPVQSFLDEL